MMCRVPRILGSEWNQEYVSTYGTRNVWFHYEPWGVEYHVSLVPLRTNDTTQHMVLETSGSITNHGVLSTTYPYQDCRVAEFG